MALEKKYPPGDIFLLKRFVKLQGHFFSISIDSITAVDSLKVSPRAYIDLIENIEDCNRVWQD